MPFPAHVKVYKHGNTLFRQDIDINTGCDVGEMYTLSAEMINMGLTTIGMYNLNAAGTAYIAMIQVMG